MVGKDDDINSNNEDNIDDNNIDNENEDDNPERNVNPVGSVVVQQAQKPAIQASQKQSGISVDETISLESQMPPSGSMGSSSTMKSGGGNIPKGPATTTTTKKNTKVITDDGTTETTTIDTTTTATTSEKEKIDEMIANTQKMASLVTQLNTVRNNAIELGINYDELVYFQRMVRPLIDSTYFLALSAQGTALTAQALNNINIAKPKQVEAAVDLAYSFVKELDCLLQVMTCRLDAYLAMVEDDGCNRF